MHQDPAQGKLRQSMALGDKIFQILGSIEAGLEGYAGEGLAPIEGPALAVEVAVVVGGELTVGTHLAGEEAAGERDAGDDADVPLLGEREELLGGLLAEDVEDDLDGLHAGIPERHPRLLDLLDTDAIVSHLARRLQTIQGLEGRVLAIYLGRRTVELEEVQGLDPEVLEAPLDEAGEVIVIVAPGGVGVEATPGLGGDEDLVAGALFQELADEPLAAAVAVDVRRVEEADAEVYGPVQGCIRFFVAHRSPLAPERPGSEAYLRDPHAGLSQIPVLQSFVPSLGVFQPVALDDPSVPAGAHLGDAPLGAVVHEHDTEALRIALRPLEVVQERPDHVAAEVNPLLPSAVRRPEVGVEVGDALLIVHTALGVHVIVDGPPVLGDVDRYPSVLLVEANQEFRQAVRLHRPAHRGGLHTGRQNRRCAEVRNALGG